MGKLDLPCKFQSMWGTLLASILNRQLSKASLLRDRWAHNMAISSSISQCSVLMRWYCMISAWVAQSSNLYAALARVSNLSPMDVRRLLNQSCRGSAVGKVQLGVRMSWADRKSV